MCNVSALQSMFILHIDIPGFFSSPASLCPTPAFTFPTWIIYFVMILRHVQRYCRYIVTRHCHPDSEVYVLPNTHVLGISLYGSGNLKTSLNSLPSVVQPSMPEVGFETATFPSVVHRDISIATAGMVLEGWGWRMCLVR